MRLTTVILIATLMQVSANSIAQKITLSKKNESIIKVFNEIRFQSGYDFVFTTSLLETAKPVNIEVKNTELKEVLDKIFNGQPLTYSIEDKTVIVSRKAPSFLDRIIDRFAAIDVRGRILDKETGNALAGASVKVKGTNKVTLTNDKGEFFLNDVKEDAIIEISFIGYVTKGVSAKKGLLEIRMAMSMSDLDQVQVIGYGTTTRRLSVENVGRVSAATIEKQPVTNFITAVTGRIPGIFITQINGLPGAPVNVTIRGRNSITGSAGNTPLYIVDGVPYPPSSIALNGSVNGANSGLSPLNNINANDIESIEVLKDAAATAIYGSRAANGVVLITTKSGKINKMGIDLQVSTGMEKVGNQLNMLNTGDYLALRREAFVNDNVVPTVANAPDLTVWDQNNYTNWQDELIGGTARYNNAQLAITGGDRSLNYRLSGNYLDEGYVLPGSLGYKKGGVNLALNHTSANNRFNFVLSTIYSTDQNRMPAFNNMSYINLPANLSIYEADGKFNFAQGYNPVSDLKHKVRSQTDNLLSNAKISYKLTDNFTLSTSLGYNKLAQDQLKAFLNSANAPIYQTGFSSSNFGKSYLKSYITEPQLSYDRQIGRGVLNVLAGATYQHTINETTEVQGLNYTNEDLVESMAAAGSIGSRYYGYTDYKYASVFSRLNYVWAGKYILNGSFRRDGSSKFGPNNKYGNFGAVGLGWVFSEEGFVKSLLPQMSFGKLKASYGTVGSDKIADYGYLAAYRSYTAYQGAATLTPYVVANPDFRWETTSKLDLTLDLGFLKDRLLLNASWYRNQTSNQLINQTLTGQTGNSTSTVNFPAIVRNSGWEFELNTKNLQQASFTWSSTFNFTTAKNKLVEFSGLATSSSYASLAIDEPLSVQKKIRFKEIDSQTGIPVLLDLDGNGIISSNGDRAIIGNLDPVFYGGLGNNFSYKGFQLDVFFQFVKQKGYEPALTPGTMANQLVSVLNRWQKPGDITRIPKASATPGNAAYNIINGTLLESDYYFADASYIRLKNVALSYTLPIAIAGKLKMKNCSFFVQGQNLLTITKFKGVDPETPSATTNLLFPPLRVVQFGLQFNL